ncbi:MAG: NAD(P)H-hydrate dehydratase [Bacteroidota bacterium]
MKIFTAEQIYKADKFTIAKQQIPSDALMERAATQLFEWMHSRLQGAEVIIQLFCGIGNNGGDGIALARLLKEAGYNIKVHVVNYSEKRSKDFLLNLERLKDRKIWPEFLNDDCVMPEIAPNDIVVDAIFGIGLNRAPSEWVGKLISHINASQAFVLAVDIPSGLLGNRIPWNTDHVIRASYVLSFQVPKLVFFLPETGVYQNQWELLDIGLEAEFMHTEETEYEFMVKPDVLPIYRPRLKFSHKGTYGHALIVGGSYGKIGAVQMAGNACLTVGSGLVTAYVPECGYHSLQAALPEAMVLTDEEDEYISKIEVTFHPDAIGIGMGLGTHERSVKAFGEFLKNNDSPMVIDADGLNILAKHPEFLKHVPKQSILTPHPKELERLVGEWKDDFDKLEKAKAFSKKNQCILVVKGAHTLILSDGKGYVNSTGNPGMATAGSGDVLTGMITGLLAQGYLPLQAAVFGVYLHGLAGDIGASKISYDALKATGIIENIGNAYMELFNRPEAEVVPES